MDTKWLSLSEKYSDTYTDKINSQKYIAGCFQSISRSYLFVVINQSFPHDQALHSKKQRQLR